MKEEYEEHIQNEKYSILQPGDWHIPFIIVGEKEDYPLDNVLGISAARCARVSYLTHGDENINVEKDLKLYERLVGSRPLHASPTEHQARARMKTDKESDFANFRDFVQFRKFLEETITKRR